MNYEDAVNDIKRDALQDFRSKMHEGLEELERRIGRVPYEPRKKWRESINAIYRECKPQKRTND